MHGSISKRIFTPSLDGHGLAIRDIGLTERGEFLIERFAFDFTYLQLVVEDYMMEIPDPVFDEFNYPKFDYGYFSARYDDYKQRTIEHVNFKSRGVAFFLEILEASLRFEKERYTSTFEALTAKGVELPDFEQIRSDLKRSVINIGTAISEESVGRRMLDNLDSAKLKRPMLHEFFHAAYIENNV